MLKQHQQDVSAGYYKAPDDTRATDVAVIGGLSSVRSTGVVLTGVA